MQVLTPTGYKDVSEVQIGDEVRYFDLETGEPKSNTILKKEWISVKDYRDCNAPQLWNDGDPSATPPTLKPEDVPFNFYVINGTWTLFQDQSIWVLRDGLINIDHASGLTVGDIIFDDGDHDVTVSTIEVVTGHSGWWRFAISGDCSYIVDGLTLHNASRFWVGGGSSGNWNATANTNWSATSGGANNASVPGTSDQCFFDANSGSGTSTMNSAFTVQGLNCTGYIGTLTMTNVGITINTCSSDSFVLSTAMTFNSQWNGGVTFTGTSGTAPIDTKGKAFGCSLTVNAPGGTVQLASNFWIDATVFNGSLQGITVTAGTFDCNGFTIQVPWFSSNNSNIRTVTQGSGNWYMNRITGSGVSLFDVQTALGLTFNKHTGGAKTYLGATAPGVSSLSPAAPAEFFVNPASWWNYSYIILGDFEVVTPPVGTRFKMTFGNTNNARMGTITVGAGILFSIQPGNSHFIDKLIVNGEARRPTIVCNVNGYSTTNGQFICTGTCLFKNVIGFNTQITGSNDAVAYNTVNLGSFLGVNLVNPYPSGQMYFNQERKFKVGQTSQTIDVFIPEASSAANGKTGLVFNTAGLTAYYRAGATGTATAITLATQTATGAYSSGGFAEIDATNMPGLYRFDIPNTVLSSAGTATIYLQGAAGMVPVVIQLEIVDTYAANIKKVNSVTVNGNGLSPPWGP